MEKNTAPSQANRLFPLYSFHTRPLRFVRHRKTLPCIVGQPRSKELKLQGEFLGPRGPLVEPSIFPSRPVPSRPPVRNNFSWVHRWAVTLPRGLRYPSNCIFYESWWCQLSNSDENTNTKTNTDTNTNTETNKGKTNDSYDVIYCLKGDDKRILNMICYRQRL